MSNTYNLSRTTYHLELSTIPQLQDKIITNITLTHRNLDADKVSLKINGGNKIFEFNVNDDIIGKNLLEQVGLKMFPLSDLGHTYVSLNLHYKYSITDLSDNIFYLEYEYKQRDLSSKEYPLNNENVLCSVMGIGNLKYFPKNL